MWEPGLPAPSRAGGGQQSLLTTCFCCRWVRSCWELVPGLGAACLVGRCRAARTPTGAQCVCVHVYRAIKSIYANGDLPGSFRLETPQLGDRDPARLPGRLLGAAPWVLAAAGLLCPGPVPTPLPAHAAPCPPPSPVSLPARRSANASPGPLYPGSLSKASSLALPAVVAWAGIWQGKGGLPREATPMLAHLSEVSMPHGHLGILGGSRQVWSYQGMPSSRDAAVPGCTWDSGPCQASPCGVALIGLKSACYHPPQPRGS